MRVTLGQPIRIENVSGAAGPIGVGHIGQAPPDGYTRAAGQWRTHVVSGAIYELSGRPAEGFRAGRTAS